MPLIITGEFNQCSTRIKKMANKFGFSFSKVDPTRSNGSKDIDLIWTTFNESKFRCDYNQK